MVKKDQEIDASFNISHLLKRTPKNGARTERAWYLMWKPLILVEGPALRMLM